MSHIKLTFSALEEETKDILIAELAEIGFEGFEEDGATLLAYINEALFDEKGLNDLSEKYKVGYRAEHIALQNWNAEWESNFAPVIVDGFCTIRADFHDIKIETPYEVIVTPKMSFGTGHHATTQLMLTVMKDLDFKSKTVLDFGSGTGILSIVASMLGADKVVALDNDEWSYENAVENIERNNCSNIFAKLGSIEDLENVKYDIILANINRHILLQYMNAMYTMLCTGGGVLMSGLLIDDKAVVCQAAETAGFEYISYKEHNGWITILFRK